MNAALIFVLLVLVGVLVALLHSVHATINRFPELISDRLTLQQVSWMEALTRKDKELREITEAYLAYQQKSVPVDPSRPLQPRSPASFKMKPNPPLTEQEKKRLGIE